MLTYYYYHLIPFPAIIVFSFLIISLRASSCGCGDISSNSLTADLSFQISGASLNWPCTSTQNIYTQSGRYISKSVIATRFQIYKDEAIVVLPRLRRGVPFTLAKFSLKTRSCRASLTPWPCWNIQEEGNCDALQSAIDIFIDSQNILWVLDVGIVNTLEQPVKRCNPKVLAINVATGDVIKTVDISGLVTSESRLQYIVADYTSDGRAFIYISDAGNRAILVFDVYANKGYRVVLPDAVLSGSNKPDVLYLQLIRKTDNSVVLFFCYLSSDHMFSINSSYLQSGQAAGAIIDVGPKPQGQRMVLLGTDNGAALFFRYKGESDIYIWNTDTCFQPDNFILVQKGSDCRLATQVVPGYKKLMWTIESNFHDYISNTVGCLGASVLVHPLVKNAEC